MGVEFQGGNTKSQEKQEKYFKMASDRMWGGLPFIVPSNTAMKYMFHEKVINEEDVPVGAHYRAREDMLNNVRGYRIVKKGLSRRLTDIEHERRRAKSEVPYISTSGSLITVGITTCCLGQFDSEYSMKKKNFRTRAPKFREFPSEESPRS